MRNRIICEDCGGHGYIMSYKENSVCATFCKNCNGMGVVETMRDEIIIEEDMVYITKKEYHELLEYKYMYEQLCK